MTLTDWFLDIALVLVVLRQVRESRLDWKTALVPLALVSWAASHYLRSIPTAGHDLVLIGAFTGTGALLGLLSGAATRVRVRDGHPYVRAGFTAAALWVLGVGTRLAFQLFTSHGGADTVARFSVRHDITSDSAWVAALVLMALAEVVARLSVVFLRARLELARAAAFAPTPGHVTVAA